MAERKQIAAALVGGSSVRSTCRMTGRSKGTVLNLLAELGDACAEYHHKHVRRVRVRRLQCDEIWSFVGAKEKHTSIEKKAQGWGDVSTWPAIDADRKLCVGYFVCDRGAGAAHEFMQDCSERIQQSRTDHPGGLEHRGNLQSGSAQESSVKRESNGQGNDSAGAEWRI